MKFVISGGGTGGNIFPAIAIADALQRRIPEAEILSGMRIENAEDMVQAAKRIGSPVRAQ